MIVMTTSSSTSVKPCRGRRKLRFRSDVKRFRPRTRRILSCPESCYQSFIGVDLHKCTVT